MVTSGSVLLLAILCNQLSVAHSDGHSYHWNRWSSWSDCQVSCGDGVRVRERGCYRKHRDEQLPLNECRQHHLNGDNRDTKSCHLQACPAYADGGWSEWGEFGPCSDPCNGGLKTRKRICNNPAPDGKGLPCFGDSLQTAACNTQACEVDGNWSSWSAFGSCTASCGTGVHLRHRECNNPPPSQHGQPCIGDSKETASCHAQICSSFTPNIQTVHTSSPRADGIWSSWMSLQDCTVTCGGGVKIRYRACNSPATYNSGSTCTGNPIEIISCNTQQCIAPTDAPTSKPALVTIGFGRRSVKVNVPLSSS